MPTEAEEQAAHDAFTAASRTLGQNKSIVSWRAALAALAALRFDVEGYAMSRGLLIECLRDVKAHLKPQDIADLEALQRELASETQTDAVRRLGAFIDWVLGRPHVASAASIDDEQWKAIIFDAQMWNYFHFLSPVLARWRTLGRFLDQWYREKFGYRRVSLHVCEATEKRLGVKLPLVVKEWFALVDSRLQMIGQDVPVRLDALKLQDGRVTLWVENQGNWSIEVDAIDSPDDLMVHFRDAPDAVPATVTEAMVGMLCSELFMSDLPNGSLGLLRETVVGGYVHDVSETVMARFKALPALAFWPTPFFSSSSVRGHETLMIRDMDPGLVWRAATPEAAAEAAAIFGETQGLT